MSISKMDKKCRNCRYRDVCNHKRLVAMAATKLENDTTSRGLRSKTTILDGLDSGDKIEKLKNDIEIAISNIPASKIALSKSISDAIGVKQVMKGW